MLSKFEPFQRLPSELRYEIWRLTLPAFGSSVKIMIHVDDERMTAAKRDVPPLLHCCHESRAAALEYYKLGFEVKSQWSGRDSQLICRNEQAIGSLNKQLYWDPREDLVCLEELGEFSETSYSPGVTCHSCEHYIATIDPDIRKLEMSEELWSSLYRLISNGFPGLEDITIVLANDFRSRYLIDVPVTDQQYSNTCRALIQRIMPPSVQSRVRFEGEGLEVDPEAV
ncbi:hypothetical protein N431DRAFT_436770 [Stipitochalara longipes BDJ]|nr:hypothetical protein N431DRAFT_436770 [Stipitochalara longipes BDJ]